MALQPFSTRRQILQSCGLAAGLVVTGQWASAGDRLAMRAAATPANHPLAPAIRVGSDSIQKAKAINDYAATFVKTENVRGSILKGRMKVKIRNAPFSLYMKFEAPSAGRELIYVDGAYGGSIKVHETGIAALVGTLSLSPTGSMAMAESRYPVTMMGIQRMAEIVVEQWIDEAAIATPKVQYYPNATLGTVACRAIESTHAVPARGLKFQRTRLYMETESGLPVRVQQYEFAPAGGQPVLVEDYAYVNLRSNVGLTNADFDIANPSYGF